MVCSHNNFVLFLKPFYRFKCKRRGLIYRELVPKSNVVDLSRMELPGPYLPAVIESERFYTALWVMNIFFTLQPCTQAKRSRISHYSIIIFLCHVFGRATFLGSIFEIETRHATYTMRNTLHSFCVSLLSSKFHADSFFPRFLVEFAP